MEYIDCKSKFISIFFNYLNILYNILNNFY